MTTFNAMRRSFLFRCRRALIIGLASTLVAVLLGGCSALRVAYDQGPTVTRWWLDSYLDFSDAQEPLVRQAVASWFDWHRSTQLTDYAQLLQRAQTEVMASVQPDQLCRWGEDMRQRVDLALDRALPLAVEAARSLSTKQVDHLEAKYAKKNADYRKDFLQPKLEDRLEASLERAIDRAQTLYGRLDPAQKRGLAGQLKSVPFDAQAWYLQRTAQQQDILRTLRQLVADRPDRERTLAMLNGLKQKWSFARRAEASAQEQRLWQSNCEWMAELHNSTSLSQRQHARDKLKGWEEDLRALAASRR